MIPMKKAWDSSVRGGGGDAAEASSCAQGEEFQEQQGVQGVE